jgi:23S rRNA pseudouridine2604 synthase
MTSRPKTHFIRRRTASSPPAPAHHPSPITRLPPEYIRINKFFTRHGIGSRREADRWIEDGQITINGQVARLGDQVKPGDVIARDGTVIPWGNSPVYIKYHKPLGITTTTELDVPDNIIAAIGHPERIFPVGRLDKDSSGLILLTNDGEIVNRILRAEHGHEKEYVVQVDRPFDQAFLEHMARGVVILGKPTRPCRIERDGRAVFRIILTEGRNRQIRRMCQALGYRVVALHRTRIMGISLEDLPLGKWRSLTDQERTRLFRALGNESPAGL